MPISGTMARTLSTASPASSKERKTRAIASQQRSDWQQKYGQRHRLVRIRNFPAGIAGPEKVRIYQRHDHYVLQWWDPAAKATLADRVEGDLVAAISRARQLEERLVHFRSSGQAPRRRLDHEALVQGFLKDLQQRADAGDIEPATVQRYGTALRHYLTYYEQPTVARAYPHAGSVNREFRLGFAAFLAGRKVAPNGNRGATVRPMRGQRFVLDTVRALFEWAADPSRGGLLPEGFRNPFLRQSEPRAVLQGDPLKEPDITLPMAVQMIGACDRFQLRLFAPMLLFGLRAAEPCFLFVEHMDANWLTVACSAELAYATKGRRDKRLPLVPELGPLWAELRHERQHGLIYERRAVHAGWEQVPLRGLALADVVKEFQRRCLRGEPAGAAQRLRLRDQVLHEAGGLNYDHVQAEFAALAQRLAWPSGATLKDLRHLFATTMNNGGLPETYRRYLMGQSLGKAPLLAYTHLNRLPEMYSQGLHREWSSLVEAVNRRVQELTSG